MCQPAIIVQWKSFRAFRRKDQCGDKPFNGHQSKSFHDETSESSIMRLQKAQKPSQLRRFRIQCAWKFQHEHDHFAAHDLVACQLSKGKPQEAVSQPCVICYKSPEDCRKTTYPAGSYLYAYIHITYMN